MIREGTIVPFVVPEAGVEGAFRPPVLIAARPGTGKSTFIGEYALGELDKEFLVLTASQIQFEVWQAFFGKLRHRPYGANIFLYPADWNRFLEEVRQKKGAVIVLDDVLGGLFWSRAKQLLRHIFFDMRKLQQRMILTAQGVHLEQIPKRLRRGIRYVLLGPSEFHDLDLLGYMLRSRHRARILIEDVLSRMGKHEMIGVDLMTMRCSEPSNHASTMMLRSMLDGTWTGDKPLPSRRNRPEQTKGRDFQKISHNKQTYIMTSLEDKILAELKADPYLSRKQLARKVNTTYATVRTYISAIRAKYPGLLPEAKRGTIRKDSLRQQCFKEFDSGKNAGQVCKQLGYRPGTSRYRNVLQYYAQWKAEGGGATTPRLTAPILEVAV